MAETNGNLSVEKAFEILAQLVAEWRNEGRITTTAGLRPAMNEAIPSFSEQDYGYDSFREFVQGAERSGHIQIRKIPGGHNLLGLPNESRDILDQVASLIKPPDANNPNYSGNLTSEPSGDSNQALRSDVWTAFVNWRRDLKRLWDQDAHNAYMYPVINDQPAWQKSPDRFLEISPVTYEKQVEWMRAWARTLPPNQRTPLVESLADAAPKGEFRRTTARLGLEPSWKSTFQTRVVEHVTEWAEKHGVPFSHLTDNRPSRVAAKPAPRGAAAASDASFEPQAVRPSARPERVDDNDLARLRRLLHSAIDRMTLAELAALPIRAEHLLGNGSPSD